MPSMLEQSVNTPEGILLRPLQRADYSKGLIQMKLNVRLRLY